MTVKSNVVIQFGGFNAGGDLLAVVRLVGDNAETITGWGPIMVAPGETVTLGPMWIDLDRIRLVAPLPPGADELEPPDAMPCMEL